MKGKRVSFQGQGPRTSRSDTDFSVTDEVSLFFASCKSDDVETVERILIEDPSVIKQVRKGTTPLHVAARAGADRSLTAMLKVNSEATLKRDKAGFSPFARAAEAGRISTMKLLLEARPDSIKDRDLAMFTPMHRAAGNGHVAACVFLLEHGALIDDTDHKSVETPLFHACRYGFADVVQLLLEHGADVNATNDSYSTSIFICIASFSERIGQSSRVLDLLLQYKAKLNLQNNFYQTPLSLAVEKQCAEAVVKLLRAGANPSFAAYGRLSPFDDILVNNKQDLIAAFEEGLGKAVVIDKLCQLSSAMDPYYIVGKHVHILGYGHGYCVEAFRPILGLFGTLTHTIRLSETGKEIDLILDRSGVPGERFYLVPDQNFERPLDICPVTLDDDDDPD